MPSDVRARSLLALILAAPVLFLFRTIITGEEALYARDVLHQYWPLRVHVVEAWRSGHLPLWDDGSQGGLPLLANIHAAALYPPSALYQLVSFPLGYGWLVAVHLVVLVWGVFAFLRATGREVLGCAVGALAFVASAPVLGLTAFGPNLMGLAWVPWFGHALVRTGPFAGRLVQASLLIVLQCLCGDPMSVLFSALLGAAVLLVSSQRRQQLILGVSAAMLGVLSASVQLLPAYGLLQQTTRAAASDQLDWSMHRVRLLELVLPKLFGDLDGTPAFWGNFLAIGELKTPFSLSVYVGAAAFAMAIVGVRAKTRGLGLTLFIVGCVFALGSQFVAGPLLVHVPPFSMFRYPEKYVVVAALGLCVLAADGINTLHQRRLERGLSALLVVLASLGAAVGLSLVAKPAWWVPWLSITWPGLPVQTPLQSFSFATFTFASVLGAVVVAGWLPRPIARAAVLAFLVVGDSFLANHSVVFTTPSELFTERPPVVDSMLAAAPQQPFRVWRDNVALAKIQFATETPEQRVMQRAWELLTLKSSLSSVFGMQELSGNSPVVLMRWHNAIRSLSAQPGSMLLLYNTCFVVGPARDGERIFAPMPEGAAVRQVECLPRLFSVTRTELAQSPAEALARASAPGFSIRDAAIIESGTGRNHLERVQVGPLEHRSGHLSAHVSAAAGGGVVVFGTSWAKGWQVTIDGHEAPLRIANGVVMAVDVPAGDHHLAFDFEEPMLPAGGALSVLGLLLIGAVGVGRRRLSRHHMVS